ncbi:MAG: 2-oxo acid dehydrogenase subunit E2 [Chloroflexi bacterium]|nr:2-oxo acid dehydrogenase subunit E2 [Chloroflexota bacterium]
MMMSTKSVYEVIMPKLGLIMTEALLVEWHKDDQEWVDHGEVIFSLESDKTLIDIEAPASGYIQILVAAGETIPVLTPVAMISAEQGDTIQVSTVAGLETTTPISMSSPAATLPKITAVKSGEVRATPKARKEAHLSDLNLAGLKGTGPRGMVVSADLNQLPAKRDIIKATPLARKLVADFGLDLNLITGTGPGGRISRDDVNLTVKTRLKTGPDPAEKPSLPLTGLRGVIARRLSDSWNERPQVTLFSELDASRLVNKRLELKEQVGKISYNSLLMLACAQALVEYPHLNVQLTETELISLDEVNIGLAVDTARGLMVPVLHNADQKTIGVINEQLLDLVERTINGKLLPGEYNGGCFTITNLGAFGIDYFSPIINPPETAILGVGRITKKPAVRDGELVIRDALTLSLSFDHRLIDGAPAAEFLHRICDLLENPETFIILDQ